MNILIQQSPKTSAGPIEWNLPGSKSLSHRYLIAQCLYAPQRELLGLSTCSDTLSLQNAMASQDRVYFEDGATPLRFYLALAAAMGWKRSVDAGPRLKERPLQALLQALGLEPTTPFPLALEKRLLPRDYWNIDTEQSSQFLSALLLVAPYVHGPGQVCRFHYARQFASKPYADMTLKVLEYVGVQANLHEEELELCWNPQPTEHSPIVIEADWSAFAFACNACLTVPGQTLVLPGLKDQSIQGDQQSLAIYQHLGLVFQPGASGTLSLCYPAPVAAAEAEWNLAQMPDAAPAIACAYAFTGTPVTLTGLSNLRFKESDRIQALIQNLEALGYSLTILGSGDGIHIPAQKPDLPSVARMQTYQDHRIAMALSLFASRTALEYSEWDSVKKSFPDFWEEMQKLTFERREYGQK